MVVILCIELLNMEKIEYEKKLNIGNEIRKELIIQNRTTAWLAENVDIDRSNLNKLLKKGHLKCDLLSDISIVLKKDFFKYYSDQFSEITGKR